MATLTSSLVVKLVDGITAPAKKAAQSLAGIGTTARRLNGASVGSLAERLGQASTANAARMSELRGKMFDAATAGYGLARALQAPVRAAMNFESAMADVAKVVEFSNAEAFKGFQNTILEMSTRIPMAASGLGKIAAAAGQAGLALNEIAPFTEMAAKIGTAFDISADQAGDALAKLKTALGLSIEETGLLADAMNHLSNSMASSAPDILDVVRRVGAQAKQFGFSGTQVSAFASAMLAAGAESDVAATSFRNMGLALTKGGSATKAQRGAFKALGMDSIKVAKAMQKDAVGTTIMVLEAIGKLPKHVQASISNDLFGSEARALGPLLTNLDLLKQSIGLVAKETDYAGSAQKEFEARSKTFANTVQLFRNRFERLGITLGTILIPPLSAMLEAVTPLVEGIRSLAETFPGLTKALVIATAALTSFRVATIAAAFAGTFLKGGLVSAGLGLVSFGSALKTVGAAALLPFSVIATRVAGVVQTVALRFRLAAAAGMALNGAFAAGALATFGRALVGLLNPLALVRGALVAIRFALVSTGIGAIVVGLAMAGAWIYNNWSNLGIMFEAFKGAFMRAIGPVRPALEPLISGISTVIGWVQNLTREMSGDTFARWGIAAGDAVGKVVVWFVQLPGKIAAALSGMGTALYDAGVAGIESLWNGMKAKFGELLAWLQSVASQAASYLSFGGGGEASSRPQPTLTRGGPVPARARGGHVKADQDYLVGEEGPELFRAGKSGTINTAAQTRAANAGSGGAPGAVINFNPTFNVSGVPDPVALARETMRVLQSELARARRGSFADLGLRTV